MTDSKSPFSFQQFASTYWRPDPAASPASTAASRRQTLTAQDLSTRRQIFRPNQDDLQDREQARPEAAQAERQQPETALDSLRRSARESWREKLSAQQAEQIREDSRVIQTQDELISALFDVLDGKRPREEVERLRRTAKPGQEISDGEAGTVPGASKAQVSAGQSAQGSDATAQRQAADDKAVQAEPCDSQQPQAQQQMRLAQTPIQIPLTASPLGGTAAFGQPSVLVGQQFCPDGTARPVIVDTQQPLVASQPLDSASTYQPALALTAPAQQLPEVQQPPSDSTLAIAAENDNPEVRSPEAAHRHRRRSERHSSPHAHGHRQQDRQDLGNCEESSQFFQVQPDQQAVEQPSQHQSQRTNSQNHPNRQPEIRKQAARQPTQPEALLQKYLPDLLQKRAFRSRILPQIAAASQNEPACFVAKGRRIVSGPKDFQISKDSVSLQKAFPGAVCCVFAPGSQLRAVALRQPCAVVVVCAAAVQKLDLKDNYALQAADVSGCGAVRRMRWQAGEIVGAEAVGELIGGPE